MCAIYYSSLKVLVSIHKYALQLLRLLYLLYNCGLHKPTTMHASFVHSFSMSLTALATPLHERYAVDIDGVQLQVANMTADEFHSKITDHSNGFVTVSLPLTQRLSKKAVTVNMTKFNTVPTNMRDGMGNIVTEMVTWETSAVFGELHIMMECMK